jgi:hypothetical protein
MTIETKAKRQRTPREKVMGYVGALGMVASFVVINAGAAMLITEFGIAGQFIGFGGVAFVDSVILLAWSDA